MSTSIEWTDDVWNPVTGCTKVSRGCKNCYAETWAGRRIGQWKDRPFTDVRCHPERLDQPLRWRKSRRVFVNSMSDLFHEDVPDEFIDKVFGVMALAPLHTFQVLTKRPERARAYLTARNDPTGVLPIRRASSEFMAAAGHPTEPWSMPLANVWLGVSVEDQATADERIPLLLDTPAAVRFVSYEPALGPVDFGAWLPGGFDGGQRSNGLVPLDDEVREDAAEEGFGVSRSVGRPGTHRLPPPPLGAPVVPSNVATAHGGVQPLDDLGCRAVDRDSHGPASVYPDSSVDVPLAVEQPGDVSERGGVVGHRDRLCEHPRTGAPSDPGGVDASGDRAPGGPESLGDLGDGGASLIRGDDLGIGQIESTHTPHCIDWLILGGESGPGARPFDLAWARSVIEQGRAAGVPVFVKQLGARPVYAVDNRAGDGLDVAVLGRTSLLTFKLRDRKGGDPDEWPEDLRVREFPGGES